MGEETVPAGFEPIVSGMGFGLYLGQIYRKISESVLAFRVLPDHLNVAGACHGGAVTTFADMQGPAVKDRVPGLAGHTPTINLTTDFIGPALLGAWVEMHVTLIRHTRSLMFTQATIMTGEHIVARTSAIYRWYTARDSVAA